ncbi:MAG: CerR family C-terminal domain-containing protein [Desulfobacteraceae bacterium]|jgi:AcrR family transcriptional regulator
MEPVQLPTRERIVETATDIFGKNGFKATTIRMIANEAGVNVASINYYFGDKEGLYTEVIETLFSKGFNRYPSVQPGSEAGVSAEERLLMFIRGTIYRLFSPDGWGGITGSGRLIVKEMLEPTAAFDKVVDKYIRPHKEVLVGILREIVGEEIPVERILLCVVSILGQCIYYAAGNHIIARIASEYLPVEKNIDEIVGHVHRFSLGGLERIKQECKEAL